MCQSLLLKIFIVYWAIFPRASQNTCTCKYCFKIPFENRFLCSRVLLIIGERIDLVASSWMSLHSSVRKYNNVNFFKWDRCVSNKMLNIDIWWKWLLKVKEHLQLNYETFILKKITVFKHSFKKFSFLLRIFFSEI